VLSTFAILDIMRERPGKVKGKPVCDPLPEQRESASRCQSGKRLPATHCSAALLVFGERLLQVLD